MAAELDPERTTATDYFMDWQAVKCKHKKKRLRKKKRRR